MRKAQAKLDEFSIVLLAGLILIAILMFVWTTPLPVAGVFLNVTPEEVRTNIQLNTSSVVLLEFNGTASNITLSVTGEMKPWISFDKNRFDVNGKETIEVNISVPPSADVRSHTSNLIVTYDTQKITIPLTVVVSLQPVENLKLFPLGVFTVSGGATETLDSKKPVFISQSYFSSSKLNLFGSLTSDKMSKISKGVLTILVEDENPLGNLIVTLNDQKIFDEKVGLGELKIPINKSLFKESNTLTISAGTPGMLFWAGTEYKLRSADFSVVYPSETKDVTFKLTRNEVENFKYARVTFSVNNYQLPLSNLKISINDQLVYVHSPPLAFFRDTFSNSIFGDKVILNSGDNKISFSFDGQGLYAVSDAALVVSYGG